MPCQALFGVVLVVQLMPSGLVMTLLVPPLNDTAAKRPNSGDQHKFVQPRAAAAVLTVQLTPSGLVMTRFVPFCETDTKSRSCGDQHIPHQVLSSTDALDVHVETALTPADVGSGSGAVSFASA